ncbi:MAG: hypothetical protein ACRC4N_06375, partial [Gammaproteobacteria bacterium]
MHERRFFGMKEIFTTEFPFNFQKEILNILYIYIYSSSPFGCSLSGVATANHLSPPNPILYILLTP